MLTGLAIDEFAATLPEGDTRGAVRRATLEFIDARVYSSLADLRAAAKK